MSGRRTLSRPSHYRRPLQPVPADDDDDNSSTSSGYVAAPVSENEAEKPYKPEHQPRQTPRKAPAKKGSPSKTPAGAKKPAATPRKAVPKAAKKTKTPAPRKTPVKKGKGKERATESEDEAMQMDSSDAENASSSSSQPAAGPSKPAGRVTKTPTRPKAAPKKVQFQGESSANARASPFKPRPSPSPFLDYEAGFSSPPSPPTPAAVSSKSWGKRPARDIDVADGTPSPKRAKTRDTSRSSPAQPETLTIEDADDLFEAILARPRALDLGQVSVLVVRLQEKCFRFSERHFGFQLSPDQEAAWPLHLLATDYYPLFTIARYLADAGHCGWRAFFTQPEHRVPLVHGILGEWFKQRIFKVPGFGLPEDKVKELRDIDRDYLHYDAIVRNKKRALCIEELKFREEAVSDTDSGVEYFPEQHEQEVHKAAENLAKQMMKQLKPLLPPPVFDPLSPNISLSDAGTHLKEEILKDLVGLIKLMASLQLSIRLMGIDGTILRLAPHVPKGSVYHVSEKGDNICVNAKHCNSVRLSQPQADRDSTLRVQMTCWGRLEAVVPRGPDRLDLEQIQQRHAQNKGTDVEFSWDDYEESVFPILPYDLQESDEGRSAAKNEKTIPGTEWSVELAELAAKEERDHTYVSGSEGEDDEDDEDDEPQEGPSTRHRRPKVPKPIRGSFVTVYPKVAPTNLYCAWIADADDANTQSLAEAVDEARNAAGLSCRVADFGVRVVNTALYHNVWEWALAGGLTGLAAYLFAHRQAIDDNIGLLQQHISDLVVKLCKDVHDGVPLTLATNYLSAVVDWCKQHLSKQNLSLLRKNLAMATSLGSVTTASTTLMASTTLAPLTPETLAATTTDTTNFLTAPTTGAPNGLPPYIASLFSQEGVRTLTRKMGPLPSDDPDMVARKSMKSIAERLLNEQLAAEGQMPW